MVYMIIINKVKIYAPKVSKKLFIFWISRFKPSLVIRKLVPTMIRTIKKIKMNI